MRRRAGILPRLAGQLENARRGINTIRETERMHRMSDAGVFTIYTDGAARGNPGPAAYAYIIERPGQDDVEFCQRLGNATNNVAEYTALIEALKKAKTLGGRRLIVHSDSELMVKQMNGEYKVKNAGLQPLFEEARRLRGDFDRVDI